MNQGVQGKRKLWSEAGRRQLESLPLLPWASRRRAELLQLLDQLEASISELDRAAAEQASARPAARRLMRHPGVGAVTALAFALTMGPAERFQRGNQVASYLGLIPSGHSSGERQQRLGHISQAVHSCAGCWWKRRRVRCGMSRRCVAPINDWLSGSVVRWQTWPWHGSWQ